MFILFILKKLDSVEILGFGWLVFMIFSAKEGIHTTRFMDVDYLLKYGHLFFAGILFYRLKTKGATWFRYACLGLCLLVQSMVKIGIHNNKTLDPATGTFVIFIFFVAFYLFVQNKISFITIKPMVYLGTISYSLYITHTPISNIVIKYLFNHRVDFFWIFLFALASSLLVATAMTYAVEKPAMSYIRNIYKQWRSTIDNKKLAH